MNRIGWIGLVVAFVALGLAILPEQVTKLTAAEDPSLEEALREAERIYDRVVRGEREVEPLRVWALAAIVTGLAGILLGVVSWVREGERRLAIGSVAVAAAAVLWAIFRPDA